MNSLGKPIKTITSWVNEEHYERLWKIKDIQNALENPNLKLLNELEIKTAEDSPLHSKWTVGLQSASHSSGARMIVFEFKLEKIFREETPKIQSSIFVKLCRPKTNQLDMETSQSEMKTAQSQKGLQENESHMIRYKHPIDWKESKFVDAFGNLAVHIKLTLFNVCTGTHVQMVEENFKNESISMARNALATLLAEDSVKLDVKLICSDGKELRCHKSILKTNSPVFKAMLESSLSEAQTGEINLEDISGETMEVLIRYLYTGRLQECRRDPDITLELTYAAGKYQIKRLLEYLDNVLGDIVDENGANVISLMNLARKLSLKKAEGELSEKIIQRTLSIESTNDLLSVFGNDDAE